jgi:hypothetical protein
MMVKTRTRHSWRFGIASAVSLVALFVGGCAERSEPLNSPKASSLDKSHVSFVGPWADDFAYAYDHFDSEFGHRALEDSQITEQELLEAEEIISVCYESHGFSVTWDKYGHPEATRVSGNEDGAEVIGICDFADGGVQMLYYQISANPDNEDPFDIRAECLMEKGLVPSGFSGKDLESLYDNGDPSSFPFDPSDPNAVDCLNSPSGSLVGG